MGNKIGGTSKAKVMNINGDTFKTKTPIQACDIVRDYPGHVLLESRAVKEFGIRAKPLAPRQLLKPKKIYFLVELPKFPHEKEPILRRARSSVINMTAKDRLECLMLSRRSNSDLPITRSDDVSVPVRVKMRLPRAELEKLVEESRDEAELANKIIEFYAENGNIK